MSRETVCCLLKNAATRPDWQAAAIVADQPDSRGNYRRATPQMGGVDLFTAPLPELVILVFVPEPIVFVVIEGVFP